MCIDVDDLERAIAFYGEAFGFSLARRLDAGWAELAGAPVPLDLLQCLPGSSPSPRSPGVRSYERHWTPIHLDLAVDDIQAAVARAVAAGARLEVGIDRRPYGFLAVLGDPFGHGLCLLQFTGRGYDELAGRTSSTLPSDASVSR